jgi:hypothetical protein
VAQQGRPRVVLFGDQVDLKRPTLVSAWPGTGKPALATPEPAAPTPPPADGSEGSAILTQMATPPANPGPAKLPRLMLVAETPTDQHRLLYRYPDRIDPEGNVIPGRAVTSKVSYRVPELVEFLARATTPEDPRPGLGMTYSEVVGALYAMHQGGAVGAEFVIETDLLRLKLLKAANQVEASDRPETEAEAEKLRVYEPVANPHNVPAAQPAEADLVVPLPQPSKDGKKK